MPMLMLMLMLAQRPQFPHPSSAQELYRSSTWPPRSGVRRQYMRSTANQSASRRALFCTIARNSLYWTNMSGALGHCRETWAHAPPSGHAVADKSGKSSLYNARKKGSATIPPTRQANCALVAALRCVRGRCGIREGLRQACGVGRGRLPLRKNP